jgi:hypothetical protein
MGAARAHTSPSEIGGQPTARSLSPEERLAMFRQRLKPPLESGLPLNDLAEFDIDDAQRSQSSRPDSG